MDEHYVAVIGAGGTILSKSESNTDYINYGSPGHRLTIGELLASDPFRSIVEKNIVAKDVLSSPSIGFGPGEWEYLRQSIVKLSEDPLCKGVVVAHGTASLEETAYFLDLTLPSTVKVVITGAQRPSGSVSSDAYANLLDSVRVVESPASHGVLVVMDREIHLPADVTKADNNALNAFQSTNYGPIGHVGPDNVVRISHASTSVRGQFADTYDPDSEWSRADIIYAYAGADGTLVRAATQAGAAVIVYCGLGPGRVAAGDLPAIKEARRRDVEVVVSSRTGRGFVVLTDSLKHEGLISAGALNAPKARVLALAWLRSQPQTSLSDLYADAL